MLRYRITDSSGLHEEWANDSAAADTAAARRLGVSPDLIDSLRRRITVDPVVVRHQDARWRSRQVWSARSGDLAVRIFEMLQIDEAVYDH
jgi:hypothetical protein